MISAFSYFQLGRLMHEFLPHVLVNQTVGLGHLVDAQGSDEYAVIPAGLRPTIKNSLEHLKDECVKLDMKASFSSLYRMIATLDDPAGIWKSLVEDARELQGRMVDELKYTTCLNLQGEAEKRYRANELFGKEVAAQFASTAFDVAEAGKCLALDRGTACVMHLQRVLECGLEALGKAVGLTIPLRDWGKYVMAIGDELERRFRVSGARTSDEQFYAEAHVTFDGIRRAWRNPSMHFDRTYTPDHAAEIFVAVRSFMKHLATRLSVPAVASGASTSP